MKELSIRYVEVENDYPILELDSFGNGANALRISHAPVAEQANSLLERNLSLGREQTDPIRKLDRPCSAARGLSWAGRVAGICRDWSILVARGVGGRSRI